MRRTTSVGVLVALTLGSCGMGSGEITALFAGIAGVAACVIHEDCPNEDDDGGGGGGGGGGTSTCGSLSQVVAGSYDFRFSCDNSTSLELQVSNTSAEDAILSFSVSISDGTGFAGPWVANGLCVPAGIAVDVGALQIQPGSNISNAQLLVNSFQALPGSCFQSSLTPPAGTDYLESERQVAASLWLKDRRVTIGPGDDTETWELDHFDRRGSIVPSFTHSLPGSFLGIAPSQRGYLLALADQGSLRIGSFLAAGQLDTTFAVGGWSELPRPATDDSEELRLDLLELEAGLVFLRAGGSERSWYALLPETGDTTDLAWNELPGSFLPGGLCKLDSGGALVALLTEEAIEVAALRGWQPSWAPHLTVPRNQIYYPEESLECALYQGTGTTLLAFPGGGLLQTRAGRQVPLHHELESCLNIQRDSLGRLVLLGVSNRGHLGGMKLLPDGRRLKAAALPVSDLRGQWSEILDVYVDDDSTEVFGIGWDGQPRWLQSREVWTPSRVHVHRGTSTFLAE